MNDSRLRSNLATGVLLVTISTYVTYALGLVANAVAARGLDPEDFGRYGYVVWLSGWLVLVMNNGLTTSGIRFVSQALGSGSETEAAGVHNLLRRLSLASEAVVLVVFFVAAMILQPTDWHGALYLFAGVVAVGAVSKARYLFNVSIAKGYGLFSIEPYATMLIGLLNVVAMVILFKFKAPVSAYLLAYAGVSIAYMIVSAALLRRGGGRVKGALSDPHLRSSLISHLKWTVVLTGVGLLTNKNVELFFLNATADAAQVGYFTIAASLTRAGIDLLTSGLMTVLMPAMANAFGMSGEQRVGRMFSDSMRYFTFAGLLAAGVGAYLAAPTVEVLYGAKYGATIPAFQIMAAIGGITLGESSFGSLLATTDRQRSRAILVGSGALITTLIAWIIIPGRGLTGAVLAYAISRVLCFMISFIWVSTLPFIKLPIVQLARLTFAALLAGGGAALVLPFLPRLTGFIVAAMLYAALFALMSLLLGAWTRADFDRVLGSLARYMPRLGGIRRWVLIARDAFTKQR